jgi:hypothetical protein
MHVLQLFDALVVGEDVEVVVTGLPEGTFLEAPGGGELQRLDGFGEGASGGSFIRMWTCSGMTT